MPTNEAQQAAERAAEIIDRVVISRVRVDGSVAVEWEIADKILAEFAPLLAAKDAEIGRLNTKRQIVLDAWTGDRAERDRLAAEVTELRRDAERYRWLRSDGLMHINFHDLTPETCDVGLDAAIDAAIAAQK